jgi:hypothetical protein
MKRHIKTSAFAIVAISVAVGCGTKQPSQPPPPANAANVAQPSKAAANKPAPGNQADEEPTSQAKPGTPTPPTFGGANSAPAFGQPSAPSSNPAAPAPGASSGSSKLQGLAGGLGGVGVPGSPPGIPGTASPTAGAPSSPAANASPGDNPFEDPANLLPISLSFLERANNAFKVGNVPRAYGLYQAHLISLPEDERADEMRNIRWDKKRIMPRLGYSFAVGLILDNTSRQESLKPVGTKASDLAGTAGTNNALPQTRAQELSEAAGKYASVFVDAFGKAHSDGKWSEAFRDLQLNPTSSNNRSPGQPGFGTGMSGGPGSSNTKGRTGGAGNAGGPSNFGFGNGQQPFRVYHPQDDLLFGGLSGEPGAANPRQGFGAPGLAPPGTQGFGSPNAASPPQLDPAAAKDLELPSDTIPLASGLSYIGEGNNIGELSKRAVDLNFDALIAFEVDVSLLVVNRTIKNDCRIRVINLRADKQSKDKAIASASLNNREVALDKDPDGRIETAVENLLKKMYDAYPLDELPNFKPESIQSRRLKDLVNDKVRSKLDLLFEVELYASKGLIDNTLKLAAYEKIAGADGKDLASKEPEDRIPILEKMISRQFD